MAIQAQMYPWLVLENSCGLNNMYLVQKNQQEKEELMHRNSFPHHSVISYQRDEIDLLINAQNERLRMVLQEQRKKELAILMKRYESVIKQKDEEVAKAINRNMELQTHVKRMEIEVQKWQRLAGENEAMIASLNGTIQRLTESVPHADAESFCIEGDDERERWDQEKRKMVCKSCKSGKSCVIMLPCRHLCSCKYCDAFLDSCPVCNEVKKFSIEVLV